MKLDAEQKLNTASRHNQFDLKIRAAKAADFRHIVSCILSEANVSDKQNTLIMLFRCLITVTVQSFVLICDQ